MRWAIAKLSFSLKQAVERENTTKRHVTGVLLLVSQPLISIVKKLEGLLENLYSSKSPIISSGIQSQSQDQFDQLWRFRELIPEAASKAGKVYKYDVSIPVAKFKEVTDAVRQHLEKSGVMRQKDDTSEGKKVTEVLGYGHFGDGEFYSW
jgi:FAD/FMN-containing dehydrogenase